MVKMHVTVNSYVPHIPKLLYEILFPSAEGAAGVVKMALGTKNTFCILQFAQRNSVASVQSQLLR
jgi:leucyl aminopeptidase (aminopeptidase T)